MIFLVVALLALALSTGIGYLLLRALVGGLLHEK